ALRNGQPVRLQFNSPVEFHDVLRTGPSSSLQVRFVDEGLISLRESSEFAIEDYKFAAEQPEQERAFFRLIKGGFRSVTGLIGRARNANYRVQTQTATIGIRGTDYAARLCSGGDCGKDVKDGLYGTVLGLSHGSNQITVQNEGTPQPRVFSIGQHFYVPDVRTPPQQLLQPPTFVSFTPQGKGQAAQQGGQGSGGEQASSSSGVSAESRPQSPTSPTTTQIQLVSNTQYTVTNTVTTTGTSVLLPTGTIGVLGGWIEPGSTEPNGGGGLVPASVITFSSSGFPTAFQIPFNCVGPNGGCNNPPSATLGAPIAGSTGVGFPDGSANGIFWGRWDTGTITSGGQTFNLSASNQAHLMYGTLTPADVISAKSGSLTLFSSSLGTTPTNQVGELGSGSFPSIVVNFTNRTATISSATVSFTSNFWQMPSGSGPITVVPGAGAFFLVQGSGTNGSGGWTCSGIGCGSTVAAKAGGIFLGPVGDHAGVTLSAASGTAQFNTVRVYCPSGC
ncbi:MAG: FecR domain-containing protein, partial [Clostridia bacterium]